MKLASSLLVSVLAAAAAFAQITVNTPGSVVECEPLLIAWTGGTQPYIVQIIPGSTPNGSPLEQLATNLNATSLSWTVNEASGQSVIINVIDSTGAKGQTAAFNIAANTAAGGTSCLNSTSVVAGPTSAGGSTATTGSGSGSGSSTTGTPAVKASGSTGSSTSTPSSKTSTNAAMPFGQIASGTFVGALLAMLIA